MHLVCFGILFIIIIGGGVKDCTLPRTYRGYSSGSRGFQTTDVCGVFLGGVCVHVFGKDVDRFRTIGRPYPPLRLS